MKHANGKQENVMAISIVSLKCTSFLCGLADLGCRCISRIQRFEGDFGGGVGSVSCTYFIQSDLSLADRRVATFSLSRGVK